MKRYTSEEGDNQEKEKERLDCFFINFVTSVDRLEDRLCLNLLYFPTCITLTIPFRFCVHCRLPPPERDIPWQQLMDCLFIMNAGNLKNFFRKGLQRLTRRRKIKATKHVAIKRNHSIKKHPSIGGFHFGVMNRRRFLEKASRIGHAK